MYVDENIFKNKKGVTSHRYFLRESYREDGKVKKRTIANITGLPVIQIENIKLALKSTKLFSSTDKLSHHQGISIGAVLALSELADKLNLKKVLGKTEAGKLALWQIISRIIYQSSNLSTVHYGKLHSVCNLLNMNDFNENHLYQNLDWLSLNQEKIENKLYKLRYPDNTPNNIYLYDITSSYLEGEKNELSSFGYNRDKKTGKKQIVIGLLTDGDGVPLSVEVFDGNTSDSKTVSAQLTKIKKRFKGSNIVFVGDRGMLKSDQITDVYNHGYHYITGITKPQINKLIKEGVIDKTLFDVKLSEIESDGVRYILKLNPIRKEETEKVRESKYNKLLLKAKELNEYLKEHKKASLETAEKNIVEYAKKLKINDWIILEANEEAKIINLIKDLDALDKISELDGCYVLKTDLTKEMASKEVVHSRYKDLAKVETAFRRFKTTYLEVRPLFVRKESRTRGHVFIVMLAYILIKELENKWKYENVTLKEGIEELNQVSSLDIYISGKYSYSTIPKPKASTQKLLNLIDVSLPTGFLVNVDSKKNT